MASASDVDNTSPRVWPLDESKVIVEGQGSGHPKVYVTKKNSVEMNIGVLTKAIESGRTSLDWAIEKTASDNTLRRVFGTEHTEHINQLHAFVIEWKQRLRPGYMYTPPTPGGGKKKPKLPKSLGRTASGEEGMNFQPKLPVFEPAKSGKSECKGCFKKINKDDLRVGLEVYARGQLMHVWQHPGCFQERCIFDYAPRAGSKCQATGKPIEQGELRVAMRVLRKDDYFNGGDKKDEVTRQYYSPRAVKPTLAQLCAASGDDLDTVAGFADLSATDQAELLPRGEVGRWSIECDDEPSPGVKRPIDASSTEDDGVKRIKIETEIKTEGASEVPLTAPSTSSPWCPASGPLP